MNLLVLFLTRFIILTMLIEEQFWEQVSDYASESCTIVMLSATIGQKEVFANWISI